MSCFVRGVLLFFLATSLRAQTAPLGLVNAGRPDEAIRALNAAIQSNPDNAANYNLLSRVYFQLEQWDRAIHMAEKSVSLQPQNSTYHLWLGRAEGRKAENANPFSAFALARKVKTEFEKAVSLDPADLPAHSDLAEYYLEAPAFLGGDKGKARRQAELVAPTDRALSNYILALADEKQGNSRAEEHYKQAISVSRIPARYWVELAHFYRRDGRVREMEAALEQSVNAAREDNVPEYDAAFLLLQAGRNFPGAIKMFRHYAAQDGAAEDGPVFKAHYFMGVLLEKQGNLKEAVAEYKAALALASDYRPARDALARLSR